MAWVQKRKSFSEVVKLPTYSHFYLEKETLKWERKKILHQGHDRKWKNVSFLNNFLDTEWKVVEPEIGQINETCLKTAPGQKFTWIQSTLQVWSLWQLRRRTCGFSTTEQRSFGYWRTSAGKTTYFQYMVANICSYSLLFDIYLLEDECAFE